MLLFCMTDLAPVTADRQEYLAKIPCKYQAVVFIL